MSKRIGSDKDICLCCFFVVWSPLSHIFSLFLSGLYYILCTFLSPRFSSIEAVASASRKHSSQMMVSTIREKYEKTWENMKESAVRENMRKIWEHIREKCENIWGWAPSEKNMKKKIDLRITWQKILLCFFWTFCCREKLHHNCIACKVLSRCCK